MSNPVWASRFINKPNAIILDFVAGSGTTAHAVMRLNCQDWGRQCISVTNNEVAADEQAPLWNSRLRPGDSEWEKSRSRMMYCGPSSQSAASVSRWAIHSVAGCSVVDRCRILRPS